MMTAVPVESASLLAGSAVLNPAAVARDALLKLAALRLPPTPDNYARVYGEIAGTAENVHPGEGNATADHAVEAEIPTTDLRADMASARQAVAAEDWTKLEIALQRICMRQETGTSVPDWAPFLRDLIRHLRSAEPPLAPAHKREMIDAVLAEFSTASDRLHARLRTSLRHWTERSEALARESAHALAPPSAAPVAEAVATDRAECAVVALLSGAAADDASTAREAAWRELLARALTACVSERLGYLPDAAYEAKLLAEKLRNAGAQRRNDDLPERVSAFCGALESHGASQSEVLRGLLRVLQLTTNNAADLLGDSSWMRGHLSAIAALAEGPVTLDKIATLERGLREISERQAPLRATLDHGKDAVKQMVAEYIKRVGTLATDTGEYHGRLAGYARQIEGAEGLAQLSEVIVNVMADTRGVQDVMARSREELVIARRRVMEFQQRAEQLQKELIALSDRLQEDPLTQVLNRRGLDRAYDVEVGRAQRYLRPLSLAMLDIDNFKTINDRFGHQTGDLALIHLTQRVRQSLRTSDVIARYGGEEFVILLPETNCEDAVAVMTRVQRELTRQYFMHNHERLLITFSAGVAERKEDESQDQLISRADRALLVAKQQGRNRVLAA